MASIAGFLKPLSVFDGTAERAFHKTMRAQHATLSRALSVLGLCDSVSCYPVPWIPAARPGTEHACGSSQLACSVMPLQGGGSLLEAER